MAAQLAFNVTETYTFTYQDGTNHLPIVPYSPVSLTGDGIVGLPAVTVDYGGSGKAINSTPIIGVAMNFAADGEPLTVATKGVYGVITATDVAVNKILFVTTVVTNAKSTDAPMANLPEMLPKISPRYGSLGSLNVIKCDDIAPDLQTTGANVLFFPVGRTLEAASAANTIVTVMLDFSQYAS